MPSSARAGTMRGIPWPTFDPSRGPMKLITFSPLPSGLPRPGLMLDDKRLVDIPAALGASDHTSTMIGIIEGGTAMRRKLDELASRPGNAPVLELANVKLHSPIPRPRKNV